MFLNTHSSYALAIHRLNHVSSSKQGIKKAGFTFIYHNTESISEIWMFVFQYHDCNNIRIANLSRNLINDQSLECFAKIPWTHLTQLILSIYLYIYTKIWLPIEVYESYYQETGGNCLIYKWVEFLVIYLDSNSI